ncbi:PAQR family membrane homeostasis protein TrhA [Sulfurospirillum oryzae]|uniref:PAQR family membrane homeostasis protein TrhA n=1 Tax=Sulfurospirillum oryzae TaxID=2976535 RepID=UPI0021E6ED6C|nr:hemolysin III family protein [Sulfurospirillum oryzae]
MDETHSYSLMEEIWHSITHGIGLLLSVSALTLLTVFAGQSGDGAKIASALVFGLSLMVMYGTSTLYHAIRIPEIKSILRQADHCAIYILIAGTYTPICLLGIKGAFGWTLFGIAWAIASIGMSLKLFYPERFGRLSLALYALMGWMVVVAVKPMLANLDTLLLSLLVAGGLVYTIGILFYVWKRLYLNHVIWHFFVLGGSICHFFAVLMLILN